MSHQPQSLLKVQSLIFIASASLNNKPASRCPNWLGRSSLHLLSSPTFHSLHLVWCMFFSALFTFSSSSLFIFLICSLFIIYLPTLSHLSSDLHHLYSSLNFHHRFYRHLLSSHFVSSVFSSPSCHVSSPLPSSSGDTPSRAPSWVTTEGCSCAAGMGVPHRQRLLMANWKDLPAWATSRVPPQHNKGL